MPSRFVWLRSVLFSEIVPVKVNLCVRKVSIIVKQNK